MAQRKWKAELELFHSYLRRNGLKKTYQKDLILETFLSSEGHFSVDDIYALVRRRDKKVGAVTVFRTLKSLTACGIAREVLLGDGVTRFEHNYRHPVHHHIVCTECHRTIEYVCPTLDRIQEDVIRKYNFQPEFHRFQTFGVCQDCREQRTVTQSPLQDAERVFARDSLRMILRLQTRRMEFLRDLAARNPDPEGKAVFEAGVRDDGNHAAELRRKLEEIAAGEKHLEDAPPFLHFNAEELEALIPDRPGPERGGEVRMDATSAGELVRGLHRAAAGFFGEFAAKFSDTEGEQILLGFAGREAAQAGMAEGAAESVGAGPRKPAA